MPIMRCTLPNGSRGYKWGAPGKCYPTQAGAEAQRTAILANTGKKKNSRSKNGRLK